MCIYLAVHQPKSTLAWQALAKTLTIPQLTYLREQFTMLGPNKSGYVSVQNFKSVSVTHSLSLTDTQTDTHAQAMHWFLWVTLLLVFHFLFQSSDIDG